jgi:hypothetical protein
MDTVLVDESQLLAAFSRDIHFTPNGNSQAPLPVTGRMAAAVRVER